MAAKKAGEGVRSEIVLEDYIDIEIEPFPFDHVEKRQPSFDDLKKMYGIMTKLKNDINRVTRHLIRSDDKIIEASNVLQLKLGSVFNEINSCLKNEKHTDKLDSTVRNFQEKSNKIDSRTERDEFDEAEANFVNMISNAESGANVSAFKGDNSTTFARWATRFRDYVDAMGKGWSEADKVNKLKFLLQGLPRMYFNELLDNQKDTLEKVIFHLTAKIDGVKTRDLALQDLLACRQKERESVTEFASRLIPIVETILQGKDAAALNERLRDEFLGKISSELICLLRIGGWPKTFEEAVKKAQELEVDKGTLRLFQNQDHVNAVRLENPPVAANSQVSFPQGRYDTLAQGGICPHRIKDSIREVHQVAIQVALLTIETGVGKECAIINRFVPQTAYPGYPRYEYYGPRAPRPQFAGNQFRGYAPTPRDFGQRSGYAPRHSFPAPQTYAPHQQVNFIEPGYYQSEAMEYEQMPVDSYAYPQPSTNYQPPNVDPEKQQRTEKLEAELESMRELLARSNIGTSNAPSCQSIQVGQEFEKLCKNLGEPKIAKVTVKDQDWSKTKKSTSPLFGPKLSFLGIILMFLLIMVTSCAGKIEISPRHPLICPKEGRGMLYTFTPEFTCPQFEYEANKTSREQTLRIYQPNREEYSSKAYVCKKIRKKAQKKASWSNDPTVEKLPSETLLLSEGECQEMIHKKRCLLGNLEPAGEIYRTTFKLDLTTRYFSIGWDQVFVDNCYLFESSVVSNHEEREVHTNLGDSNHCEYMKGRCQLADFTMLIWTPNRAQPCKFVLSGTWKGVRIGQQWLSREMGFGVDFFNETRMIRDCGQLLELTEQDVAVRDAYFNRKKREEYKTQEGNVRSTQAAGQLTFLSADIIEKLKFGFDHALSFICGALEKERLSTISIGMESATALVRGKLKDPNLIAERVTLWTFRVWPCVQLELGHYSFQATNDTNECFEYLPLAIDTTFQPEMAFVNAKTMLVSKTSRKGDCRTFRHQIIELDHKLQEVDQVTGTRKMVNSTILRDKFEDFEGLTKLRPHSFHSLVLTNISKVLTSDHMNSMSKLARMDYEIKRDGGQLKVTPSQGSLDLGEQIVKAVKPSLENVWWWWVTVSTSLTTIVAIVWAFILCTPCLAQITVGRILQNRGRDRELEQLRETVEKLRKSLENAAVSGKGAK
uniref:Envelope protein n=1 Tax=Ditylenchus dipsaci TaxID=166011 RepID=A0A915EP46_9BILA